MKTAVTAVLGASDNEARYSHLVLRELISRGIEVFPVNPRLSTVLGLPCYPNLDALPRRIGTLTIYLNPLHLEPLIGQILALRPERVIFNPGSESAACEEALSRAGIFFLRACTLVLLRTDQYEASFPAEKAVF